MSRRLHRHPSGVGVPMALTLAAALSLIPSAAVAVELARPLQGTAASVATGPPPDAAPAQCKAGGMIDPDG